MAKSSGRTGTLEVSTDDSSYSTVNEIDDISFSRAHDTEDSTSFTSAGNKEADYGETQATLSFSMKRDAADAGQDVVRTSAEAKTKIYYRYKPTGSGDTHKFLGKIDSIETSNKRNERVMESVKVVSSGAITTT